MYRFFPFILRSANALLPMLFVGLCVTLSAQQKNIATVQQQFNNNRQNAIQEKIFMHTDKNFYVPGEICWFKIYAADAIYHRPIDISKIAYVELVTSAGKALLQAKCALQIGSGNGSFQLPAGLASGNYRLRAYTRWMQNFDASFFFEKIIAISTLNSQRDLPSVTGNSGGLDVSFYPEGGNLINGIAGKIAIKATDNSGRGVVCKGILIRDKRDTLLDFETGQHGVTTFTLKPEAKHQYHTIITKNGVKTISQLPAADSMGYAMQLAASANNIVIVVRSSMKDADNVPVYLFAHTRGIVNAAITGNMQQGKTEFVIDKSKLKEGVTHFTIFNSVHQPVCERLYFTYPAPQMNVSMRVDKPSYTLREKVTVDISTNYNDGNPLAADLSVAVYRVDSLQGVDNMNIAEYFNLQADLTGIVSSHENYLAINTSANAEAMDQLMLTHTWQRFKWQDVLKDKKSAYALVPEYSGHIITGRVINITTRQPAAGVQCFISAPGIHPLIRSAKSDADGLVRFDFKDFYTGGQLIVQTNGLKDSLCSIEILTPFADKYSAGQLPVSNVKASYSNDFNQYHFAAQVQQTYFGKYLQQFIATSTDTFTFFKKADAVYLLDNYVRFTTMEEVLREYVNPINLRKRNSKLEVVVWNANKKEFFENLPWMLLDGVPIFDFSKILNYDPMKICKLEVVTSRYHFGDAIFDGLLNFSTYTGSLPDYPLDVNATLMDYDGLQLQRMFFSPHYDELSTTKSRLPDYRNVLYWSPDVSTNKTGKKQVQLFTSDLPGKYAIVVQGLSSEGLSCNTISYFDVIK